MTAVFDAFHVHRHEVPKEEPASLAGDVVCCAACAAALQLVCPNGHDGDIAFKPSRGPVPASPKGLERMQKLRQCSDCPTTLPVGSRKRRCDDCARLHGARRCSCGEPILAFRRRFCDDCLEARKRPSSPPSYQDVPGVCRVVENDKDFRRPGFTAPELTPAQRRSFESWVWTPWRSGRPGE